MRPGLFVTGTDTGVGKTVLAAALMHRFRAEARLRYWKPVQTGVLQDNDTDTVERLAHCPPDELLQQGERFDAAVSPHLAARLAGRTIQVRTLQQLATRTGDDRAWIVEGAGGVLVPLSDTEWLPDLMAALALPVLIAARGLLGTINHTLLSVEALRSRALPVAGIVIVGECRAENRQALEHWSGVPVLGGLPRLEVLDSRTLAAAAAAHLDPLGQLLRFLRPDRFGEAK